MGCIHVVADKMGGVTDRMLSISPESVPNCFVHKKQLRGALYKKCGITEIPISGFFSSM